MRERDSVGREAQAQGQSTVEAALMIPALLMVLFLLIQPVIFLYDLTVMKQAAQDGCRLLATARASDGKEPFESAIKRSLGAIPEQALFHVHGGSCTYRIQLEGNGSSAQVAVTITNKVKLLPLFDMGAKALGMLDEEGCFPLKASAAHEPYPSWVLGNEKGLSPKAWVDQWQ